MNIFEIIIIIIFIEIIFNWKIKTMTGRSIIWWCKNGKIKGKEGDW